MSISKRRDKKVYEKEGLFNHQYRVDMITEQEKQEIQDVMQSIADCITADVDSELNEETEQ